MESWSGSAGYVDALQPLIAWEAMEQALAAEWEAGGKKRCALISNTTVWLPSQCSPKLFSI